MKILSTTYKFFLICFCFALISCESTEEGPASKIGPNTSKTIVSGEAATIEILHTNPEIKVKEVSITLSGEEIHKGSELPLNFTWNSDGERIGRRTFHIRIDYEDGSRQVHKPSITIHSDIKPKYYSYKIINEYPHDINAYTQGLFIHNGQLYEGTGQYGESNIRKVDLETGEIIYQKNLSSQYFGEGIAFFDDKFYQLSWRSRKGWIYETDSFKLVKEFTYPVEGWGLTATDTCLLLSDGSNSIYYLNPETMSKIGKVEVYAGDKAVSNLNELELINGKLYANVWQTDQIMIIDPATGKVTGIIDLTDLYAEHDATDSVLNGIAWDAEEEKLYVTGKLWGKLFEIELIEKKE